MPKTLTKPIWDSLNDKAQWDIKAALRGPDCYNSEPIKWFTTAVIRWACKNFFRVGGLVNHEINFVVLPIGVVTVNLFSGKESWNYHHFIQHTSEAASWLDIPIVYVTIDSWLRAVLTQSNAECAKVLLSGAVESSTKPLLESYVNGRYE